MSYPDAGAYVLDLRLHPQAEDFLAGDSSGCRPEAEGSEHGRRASGQPGHGLRRPGRCPKGHRVLRAGPGHRPRDRGPKERRSWLGNLGNAYADLGDASKAIEYYEQALAIAREIGDRRGEGYRWATWAMPTPTWATLARPSSTTSRRWPCPRDRGPKGRRRCLGNLGIAYADLGDASKAIEYHEQALAIAREIGDRRGEGARSGQPGHSLRRPGRCPQGHRVLRAGAGHRPRDRGPKGRRRCAGQPGQCLRRPGRRPKGHRVLRAGAGHRPRDRGPKG